MIPEPGMKQGIRLGKFEKKDLSRVPPELLYRMYDREQLWGMALNDLCHYYPEARGLEKYGVKLRPYVRATLTDDKTASGHMFALKDLMPGYLWCCIEAYTLVRGGDVAFVLVGVIDSGDKAWVDIPPADARAMQGGRPGWKEWGESQLWCRYEDLIYDPEELRKTLCRSRPRRAHT